MKQISKLISAAFLAAFGLIMCGPVVHAESAKIEKLKQDLSDGELIIKSANPGHDSVFGDAILNMLRSKYDLSIYAVKDGDFSKIHFADEECHFNDDPDSDDYGGYQCEEVDPIDVKIKYTGVPSQKVLNAITPLAKKINKANKTYSIKDLSFVNFVLSGYRMPDHSNGGPNREYYDMMANMINFSPEFHADTAYGNVNIQTYTQGFGGFDYKVGNAVYGVMKYGDYIYAGVYLPVEAVHVIYIPSSTEETTETYAAAAQKRIDNHLRGTKYSGKVAIEYTGDFVAEQKYDLNDAASYTSLNLKNGNYYTLTYGDNKIYTLIVKKDNYPKWNIYHSFDLGTDVEIKTDSHEIPLDAVVQSEKIKSEQRQDEIDELELEDAVVYDVNAYSTINDKQIHQLSDGNFEVIIPLSNNLKNKQLVAYYFNEDGSVEEFAVTVTNGKAHFVTNHFSEYIIGTKDKTAESAKKIDNPKTTDNLPYYLLSLVGFGSVLAFAIKKR